VAWHHYGSAKRPKTHPVSVTLVRGRPFIVKLQTGFLSLFLRFFLLSPPGVPCRCRPGCANPAKPAAPPHRGRSRYARRVGPVDRRPATPPPDRIVHRWSGDAALTSENACPATCTPLLHLDQRPPEGHPRAATNYLPPAPRTGTLSGRPPHPRCSNWAPPPMGRPPPPRRPRNTCRQPPPGSFVTGRTDTCRFHPNGVCLCNGSFRKPPRTRHFWGVVTTHPTSRPRTTRWP